MRINPISYNTYTQQQPKAAQPQASFTGGASIDLAATVKSLDRLLEKTPTIYPPQIREWAKLILEEGNKANDTLVNIHKKFYGSLKECFSPEEVKAKFPEFNDILSDSEVSFKPGTFFEKVKKGELEHFDKDEDLSIQLLKLYWGEGFSLNDLKNYSDGTDIYYTMKKLQIPLVDKTYGHMLKFSDPEYNERIVREMAEKRLANLDKKAFLESGEPVYIPRGPLSKEHKNHISEGLHKFYEENPERLYAMSERQKKFYEENPERAEIFRKVLIRTWKFNDMQNVKAELSRFMKKNRIKDFNTRVLEEDPLKLRLSKQQSDMLQKFWADNPWAKKTFSRIMKLSWKMVKEEQEAGYELIIAPNGFIKEMKEWAAKKNIDTSNLKFTTTIYPERPELNEKVDISRLSRAFADEMEPITHVSMRTANTYFFALIEMVREFNKMDMSRLNSDTAQFVGPLKNKIKEVLYINPNAPYKKRQIRKLEVNDVQMAYYNCLLACMNNHKPRILDLFNRKLNSAYEYVSANWKPGKPLHINPTVFDR
ncbi:MAG: hypothetical protein LBJ74_02480 [Heliobacteriaceae bacterium]|jgi:hypothetical protein|nr:hypothetical protein [Heliobacteriaceae bacterium]